MVLAAALALAALTEPRYRRRLGDPRILWTVGLAALMVLPTLAWFWRHGGDLAQLYADEVRIERGDTYLGGMVSGFYYIAQIALYYLGPLLLTLTLVFPGFIRGASQPAPGRGSRPAPASGEPDDPARAGGRLLGRFLVAVFLLLVLAALASQLAYLKFRWLLPAFSLAPLYAWWRVVGVGYSPERLRWISGLLLAVALGILVAFVASVTAGTRLSGRPQRLAEPYDVLADGLGRAGFRDGTIVVGPGSLAGASAFASRGPACSRSSSRSTFRPARQTVSASWSGSGVIRPGSRRTSRASSRRPSARARPMRARSGSRRRRITGRRTTGTASASSWCQAASAPVARSFCLRRALPSPTIESLCASAGSRCGEWRGWRPWRA